MGWLGWTEREVMETDVNCIALALESRASLIRLVFGDGKQGGRSKRGKRGVSAQNFKSFAASHNRRASRDG